MFDQYLTDKQYKNLQRTKAYKEALELYREVTNLIEIELLDDLMELCFKMGFDEAYKEFKK